MSSDGEIEVPTIEVGLYEHYKGHKYEVIGVGIDTETTQPVVIYRPLEDISVKFWVRPYAMFVEIVEVDGKEIPRFKKI